MDVVLKIGKARCDDEDKPLQPIKMKHVSVV